MFDSTTDNLVRGVPQLPGLNREQLPQFLAECHVEIAALRVRLRIEGTPTTAQIAPIAHHIARLRKLASTLETYACILSEDDPSLRSCAFVAASAHQLLLRARAEPPSNIELNYISPTVSSALLFLIAGAFPDAAEMARKLRLTNTGVVGDLERALASLAQGKPLQEYAASSAQDGSPLESLTDALWQKLTSLVHQLSGEQIDATESEEVANQLLKVQQLTARPLSLFPVASLDDAPPIQIFAGPHHLATLLRAATKVLKHHSVVRIPPPATMMKGEHAQWKRDLQKMAVRRPWLWPNHLDAIHSGLLETGTSACISFPTGAGKSTLVQLKIDACLLSNKRVVFLVPTHSLADQTRRDLEAQFPQRVTQLESSGLTGANITVLTPEAFLSEVSLTERGDFDIGLVVLDECHLLHPDNTTDQHRSVDAMLCLLSIIHKHHNADILLLSAMMANADELAAWIHELTRRPCLSLSMDWKPTRQIRGCVVYEQADTDKLREFVRTSHLESLSKEDAPKKPPKAVKDTLAIKPHGLFSLRSTWASHNKSEYSLQKLADRPVLLSASGNDHTWYLTANRNKVAALLAANYGALGIKTMVLAQSTRDLPSLAVAAAQGLGEAVNQTRYTSHEQRLLSLATQETGSIEDVYAPANGLAGIHHGQMLRIERQLNESMFSRANGLPILVVSPTMTQGVNLPAEAIVIAGDDRWDVAADARTRLSAQELLNAAGRAGRAGVSSHGLVLVVPGEVVTIENGEQSALAPRWFELQERVFSKTDQCVRIDDPVEFLIDLVQLDAAAVSPDTLMRRDVSSLLNRLPRGATDEGVSFLMKSLGAHRARASGRLPTFLKKITSVVALRDNLSIPTNDWREDLASAHGIPLSLVSELAATLDDDRSVFDRTPRELVAWWFDWVAATPIRMNTLGVQQMLNTLLGRLDENDQPLDEIPVARMSQVKAALDAWMTGRPLNEIEPLLVNAQRYCGRSRRLAIREASLIAHQIGLISSIFENFARIDGLTIPLNLAVLRGCVREGFDEPLKYVLHGILGLSARVATHQYSRQIVVPTYEGMTLAELRQAAKMEVARIGLN